MVRDSDWIIANGHDRESASGAALCMEVFDLNAKGPGGKVTRCLLFISAVVLNLLLAACEKQIPLMTKTNPNPTAGYRVRLKIDDAPGPFDIIRVGGQFDVRNSNECGKVIPAVGLPGKIVKSDNIPLRRVGSDEYEGVIYLDAMQDEDYYGKGVCYWELTAVYALLIAKDRARDASFVITLNAAKVTEGHSATRYYPDVIYYEPGGFAGANMIGSDRRERYRPGIRDALFAVTLSGMGEAE